MPAWLRKALIFGVAFYIVNVALNIYRTGGVTSPVLLSPILSTLAFTVLYAVATLLMERLRNRKK